MLGLTIPVRKSSAEKKAGVGLAKYLIANELNKSSESDAKFFQVFTIAIYGTVVAANLRLVF